LTDLEQRLDPSRFLRIHRSVIVNVESVVQLEPYPTVSSNFSGDMVLELVQAERIAAYWNSALGKDYRNIKCL